jgi:ribonuclease PH
VNFGDALIAAVLNASTLALMNAGSGSIPMRGAVCAVATDRSGTNSRARPILVLDPTDEEFPSLKKGGGYFAFFFSYGVIGSRLHTSFDEQDLIRATDL